MRQFQCVPTTYVTENKEESFFWKFTLSKYHVHCFYLFYTSQTANQYYNTCYYTTNCLYLDDSYISKFDFMNYLFANLLVARLYDW